MGTLIVPVEVEVIQLGEILSMKPQNKKGKLGQKNAATWDTPSSCIKYNMVPQVT